MKWGFYLALFLLMGLGGACGVSAHVLATDGTIGAVLHIDPNDEPLSGSPAHFFWEFKDTAGTFKLDDCTCMVVIQQHGQQVYSGPMTEGILTYTFAQPDVYVVKAVGKPLVSGEFNPFTLAYTVRVGKGVTPSPVVVTTPNEFITWVKVHFVHAIGAVILIVVTFGMIIYERVRGVPLPK